MYLAGLRGQAPILSSDSRSIGSYGQRMICLSRPLRFTCFPFFFVSAFFLAVLLLVIPRLTLNGFPTYLVDIWDAVCTCFFMDTAKDIIAYIETIWNTLKPGGVWINFGMKAAREKRTKHVLFCDVALEPTHFYAKPC